MIAIADSGSTKTDWRFLGGEHSVLQTKTEGLNPFIRSEEELYKGILPIFNSIDKAQIQQVFFYGAGCKGQGKDTVQRVLRKVFLHASEVIVADDLLAAARATCGKEKGIACILGTGANSCLYDGETIIDHIPALGYILGDEGSGAYLGKQLINAYFKKEMPQDLEQRFYKRYQLSEQEVLDKVYKDAYPNKFLASLTRFLHHTIQHPFVKRLVYEAFKAFFQKNIIKYEGYQELKVHFSGSIAFYFNDILRYTASELGITLGIILEKPIAGLTLYHEKDKY